MVDGPKPEVEPKEKGSKSAATAPSVAIGWINYLNLRPLRIELERLLGRDFEIMRGVPAQVNRWLGEGKVSLAPSSSVCLLRNPQLEVALPVGIASCGQVMSVYIGMAHEDMPILEVIRARQLALREVFRAAAARHPGDIRKMAALAWKAAMASPPPLPVADVPPLAVTSASATSAALGRILYRLWFGEAAYEMRAAESRLTNQSSALCERRPMELLIGDEALNRRGQFRAVIDLGEAWRDLTDLPFVFAVWQASRKVLSPQLRQKMLEAADLAQARMRVDPTHYMPDPMPVDALGRPIDLRSYWKCIQYRLGPNHFRALALYLSLARLSELERLDGDASIAVISRWEAIAAQRSGEITLP